MNNISNVDNCYGCRACEFICPNKSIIMVEDSSGFLHPKVNDDTCVNCGLCLNKCQSKNEKRNVSKKECFVIKSKNIKQLNESASGGVFGTIAKNLFKENWNIFGCQFTGNLKPIIKKANSLEDIKKMCGSKYVASDTLNSYVEVRGLLESGDNVLYCGLPCQCAGLQYFLGSNYKNLITMELICHGTPSEKIFHKYIDFIQDKYKDKIHNINFRTKHLTKWGEFVTEINFTKKNKFLSANTDLYYQMFFSNKFFKETCYSCKYASDTRGADITIGDAWGIAGNHNDKGLSCLIANTEKGLNFFKSNMHFFDIDNISYDFLKKYNAQLSHPSLDLRSKNHYENIDNLSFKKFLYKENIKIKRILLKKIKQIIRNLKRNY